MSILSNIHALEAAAGTAEQGGMGGMLSMLLPFVLMIAIFYFIGIRPQKKQEKEANEMRNNLLVGDEITTIGGIVGRVVNIREENIVIETSSDRTKMKIARWAIRSVEKKSGSEPAQDSKPATFKVKK